MTCVVRDPLEILPFPPSKWSHVSKRAFKKRSISLDGKSGRERVIAKKTNIPGTRSHPVGVWNSIPRRVIVKTFCEWHESTQFANDSPTVKINRILVSCGRSIGQQASRDAEISSTSVYSLKRKSYPDSPGERKANCVPIFLKNYHGAYRRRIGIGTDFSKYRRFRYSIFTWTIGASGVIAIYRN